ncbi:MAG TPA: DinB family protein [Clostridia bacterium]|nr:DinB family protein [Clostridia bacterium]
MTTASTAAMTPEFAVALRDFLLESVTGEFEATKKVVGAVLPGDYRPDPKSKTAPELAKHIVEVEVQFLHEIANGEFKMEPMFPDIPAEPKALAQWYEQEFPKAVQRVRDMTAEQLVKPVDFYGVMTMPVVKYLGFVDKHSVHHRGQLSTYLRPLGGKVPGIYGGSADEPWQG